MGVQRVCGVVVDSPRACGEVGGGGAVSVICNDDGVIFYQIDGFETGTISLGTVGTPVCVAYTLSVIAISVSGATIVANSLLAGIALVIIVAETCSVLLVGRETGTVKITRFEAVHRVVLAVVERRTIAAGEIYTRRGRDQLRCKLRKSREISHVQPQVRKRQLVAVLHVGIFGQNHYRARSVCLQIPITRSCVCLC